MGSAEVGGLGEVSNAALPAFMARYRASFSPLRYTSLGLALIEAMMVGLPLVGFATTELATVIRNGENGFIDNRPERLHDALRRIVDDPGEARIMGRNARAYAQQRFGIGRFVDDWMRVFAEVAA
jgi:glycosyltransferase involved in cell wall biosynthesis